ncbi:hypothetical protein [Acidipropionibacterium virtanenii]|uniref:Uncharacterized protein n=1 Tax=Acidipropionibacterium virtanenii TaxID=2057246 RepID=A0A344UXJ8_9ACTN|nr:hypothetical protein [Acidipropionibacterium virtanenii]AXE39996.1 hypothetical protein JS278_02861 [Acidipropionibacterium virtanenii]
MGIQPRFNVDIVVWLLLAAALVVSFIARLKVFDHQSPDFRFYLVHWYEHVRAEGYPGFRTEFANYNFPYLYMLYLVSLFKVPTIIAIKSISIFFDYLLGFAVWWLVRGIRPESRFLPVFAAITVLCMPTVILNSAVWGQAEAIYVSFLMLALGFWVRGRFPWAWLVFGVSFSIKLQAVFLLPLLAVLWLIDRRQKLWAPALFLVAPVLAPIPAIIWGRPVGEAYGVYVNQASGYFDSRTSNFMAWMRVPWQQALKMDYLGSMATAITMGILLISVAAFLIRHKGRPGIDSIMAMAAFATMVVPFFLPDMRDRYFYAGEMLTLVWAFLRGRRRAWLPLLVSVPIMLEYTFGLFHSNPGVSSAWRSFALLAAIVVLAMDAFRNDPEVGGQVVEEPVSRTPEPEKGSAVEKAAEGGGT